MIDNNQEASAKGRIQEVARLKMEAAQAIRSGNAKLSGEILRRVVELESNEPSTWLNLAATLRAGGDLQGALNAIESALKLDARLFLGLLLRGVIEEKLGYSKRAACSYSAALSQAPPIEQLDEHTQRALVNAREVCNRHAANLEKFLKSEIGLDGTSNQDRDAKKVELFIDVLSGRRRLYKQEPTAFEYPGMPSIEFYDRAEFPWLQDFESQTAAIQRELVGVRAQDTGFTPYVEYPDDYPLDQWAELNRSTRWSAFHFYHHGRRYEENCIRCPQTMTALSKIPQPVVPKRMPAAMFSVLKKQTQIPAHTGVANVRLVVHLPLIVPPGCRFRVGNETRPWRVGEAWVFDDTIEHEAWNESDEDRVILICDIWNPRLNESERHMISGVLEAMDKFNGFVPNHEL